MGLNLSNVQIALELGLNSNDVQRMTEQLCQGIVACQPEPILSGAVECTKHTSWPVTRGIRLR